MIDSVFQFLWLALIPSVPILLIIFRNTPLIWVVFGLGLFRAVWYYIEKALGNISLDNLQRRAVFITGCDTGFGNLLAHKCLESGMPVYAGCLSEKGATALTAASKNLPGHLETIVVDVSNEESVQKATAYLEKASGKYGGLHAVVNNAGIVGSTFFDDFLTTEDYKKVAEVNTWGIIRVTQALKHLVKKTRGRFVTVTSICSRVGLFGFGPYNVSKFAAAGYLEVIRQELRQFGVSVHILEPGFFKTPINNSQNVQARLDSMWKGVAKSVKEEYGEEFFKLSCEHATKGVEEVSDLRIELVVEAYFNAITSRFPKLRYFIGDDAHFFFVPMSYLPTGMRDSIFAFMRSFYGSPVPVKAIEKYSKKFQ